MKKFNFLPYRHLRSIHFVSMIALLWGLSDAIVSFALPIQVQTYVGNLTLFGFLIGFSSLIGAFSDPILGYISNRIRYTVLMFIGLLFSLWLVVTALMPLSIVIILWLMAAWGLYYEFIEIGVFAYVSRHHAATEQSKYFGIVYLFLTIPYIIGPIIGGYLIDHGNVAVYGVCLLFIVMAILFLPRLVFLHRRRERPLLTYEKPKQYHFRQQLKSFRKVWRYASVFFIAVMLYNVWSAFTMTLVPLQSIGGNPIIAGLIASTFALPMGVFSGYGGAFADRYGRNATFVIGFFVAALFTFIFGMQDSTIWQIMTAGLSSLGFAFAYPAMMGETSSEGQNHESELGNMAAVQRIFVNTGYILGPVLGGIFARFFGLQRAFAVLGVAMLICFIPLLGALVHFHIKGRMHKALTVEFNL